MENSRVLAIFSDQLFTNIYILNLFVIDRQISYFGTFIGMFLYTINFANRIFCQFWLIIALQIYMKRPRLALNFFTEPGVGSSYSTLVWGLNSDRRRSELDAESELPANEIDDDD